MTTTTEPFTGTDARGGRAGHGEHKRQASDREKEKSSVLSRILVGVSGGALAYYGLRRRNIGGALLAIAGSGVVLGQVVGGGNTKKLASRLRGKGDTDVHIDHSVLIMRSPQDVYDAWCNFEELPRIFSHVDDITETSPGRTRWKARVLAGASVVEWESENVEERPGELLAWRSLPGSPLTTTGSVRFSPALGADGEASATLMRLEMSYAPASGGAIAKTATRLFNPAVSAEVKEDLRRFKAELEAGEVPTTEGQPHGSGRRGKSLWDRVGGQR